MGYTDLTQYKAKKRKRAIKRKRQDRPKTIIEAANKILENEKQHITFRRVEEIDQFGMPTGKIVNVRIQMVNTDALAIKLLREAATNNDMLKALIDHNSGRAVERHKISLDNETGAGFVVELK